MIFYGGSPLFNVPSLHARQEWFWASVAVDGVSSGSSICCRDTESRGDYLVPKELLLPVWSLPFCADNDGMCLFRQVGTFLHILTPSICTAVVIVVKNKLCCLPVYMCVCQVYISSACHTMTVACAKSARGCSVRDLRGFSVCTASMPPTHTFLHILPTNIHGRVVPSVWRTWHPRESSNFKCYALEFGSKLIIVMSMGPVLFLEQGMAPSYFPCVQASDWLSIKSLLRSALLYTVCSSQ